MVFMVPLGSRGARHALSGLGPEHRPGLLALRHALGSGRPGLWGDDSTRPRSVLLVRNGEGRGSLEAFGTGEPGPAVVWLARQGPAVALLAPPAWETAVRAAIGPVDRVSVETRSARDPDRLLGTLRSRPAAATRRLSAADAAGFLALAPSWALRGWGMFADLIACGAAFGVPQGLAFAALAWTFDQTPRFDALGVVTDPRFRRLGLGRTVASALLAHVLTDRGKVPLWSTASENAASLALASSLGLSIRTIETLLRWPPR